MFQTNYYSNWAVPILSFVCLEMKAVICHARVGLIGKNRTQITAWLTLKMVLSLFFGNFFISLFFFCCIVLYALSSDWRQASIFAMIEHGTQFPPLCPVNHMQSQCPMHSPLILFPFYALSLLHFVPPSYVSNWVFISQNTDKTHLLTPVWKQISNLPIYVTLSLPTLVMFLSLNIMFLSLNYS